MAFSRRTSFYLVGTLLFIIWMSCSVQKANPAHHNRAKRQISFNEDDDVEILAPAAVAKGGQKSSSIQTYKGSVVAPNKLQQEFDDENSGQKTGTKSSKTTKKQHQTQTEEIIEYEEEEEPQVVSTKKWTKKAPEEIEEIVEYEEIEEESTTGHTTGKGKKKTTKKITKTEEEFTETTEDKIRHLFGNGLVCLDVHDEKTKTTPSFQALVDELTNKYGKKPHIHVTTPKPGSGTAPTDDQQNEYDYFVYDQVEELDPITKKIRKVIRRRKVTSIQEYNEFVKNKRKVLRKIKKKPKCSKLGLVGDLNDCTKFHECTPSGPVEKDCPPGTIFHEQINACNHAWAVDPKPPCWSEEDDDPQVPLDSNEEPTDGWTPPFPGSPDPIEEFEQPQCKKSGFFELPNECRRGYQCLAAKGKVEFKQYINCELNEAFLESEGDCVPLGDLPAGHRCKSSSLKKPEDSDEDDDIPDTKSAPPTTAKPEVKPAFHCEKLGKFPHPTKCDTYYTCFISNKKLRSTKHKCAAGSLFDVEEEKCSSQENIKVRPDCADHDPKVDWPEEEDPTGPGQIVDPGNDDDQQQVTDGDVVDFDEDDIETYKDENGITKRRLKRTKKITYEYEYEDPSTKTIKRVRRVIRTRKVTRGEQLEELEKITKRKVRRVLKRKVTDDVPDEGQQTEDINNPDVVPSPDDSDEDDLDLTHSAPPPKKVDPNDPDKDDDGPAKIKDCTHDLAEIEHLKRERDEAIKGDQGKDRIIRTMRKEKESNLEIIEEKTEIIRELTKYKDNTKDLVDTLKRERDEARLELEELRKELEKVKEILNQIKIQKEIDDAELIRLRRELNSCNTRYNNMKKVMEGNDLALKSCKQEVTTLQQCCDNDQNALVKSRKRRSTSDGLLTPAKSNFQHIVQHQTPSAHLEEDSEKRNEEVTKDGGIPEFLANQLADSEINGDHPHSHSHHHNRHKSNQTTIVAENKDTSNDHRHETESLSFYQQLPLLIFIFLTLLLVSVIIIGCFVLKKLNSIAKLAISAEEFETSFQEKVKPSSRIEKAFTNQTAAAEILKGDKNTKTKYFAYIDE